MVGTSATALVVLLFFRRVARKSAIARRSSGNVRMTRGRRRDRFNLVAIVLQRQRCRANTLRAFFRAPRG
jgi:hypothetical protein